MWEGSSVVDEVPGPEVVPPSGDSAAGVSLRVFEALNGAVEGARRARCLGEVLQAQTMLALWDAVVVDETARGLVVREGGLAERAFSGHLAGLLQVSRNRAIGMLHTATAIRDLPVSWGVFGGGGFGWQAVESIVRNRGTLTGDALDQYDLGAARLSAETVPQCLDPALSRLHDALDHDAATDAAASAHRTRSAQARPGAAGAGTLTLTGPETDIAAMHDAAHRAAVAAHGVEGETRTIRQLMYDCLVDVILHGLAAPAPAPAPVSDGAGSTGRDADAATTDSAPAPAPADPTSTPADPFERLGDPRVPQRKAIQATIVVTVPAATAVGAGQETGKLAGWESLAPAEARRIIGAARHWTRVELDPVDDAILAFDSHEGSIPAALRRLIWARSETCDQPHCPAPAHHADIDHVVRVEHGGRTTHVNLSALCRSDHQTKDDGYVDVRRDPDGTLTWNTTRWGGRTTKKPALRIRPAPAPAPAAEDDDSAPWDTAA